MVEVKAKKAADFYKLLGNENRVKIVLLCSNKGFNVKELSVKLGISYNLVSEYVSSLVKEGILNREKNPDQTVTLTSKIKVNDDLTLEWK